MGFGLGFGIGFPVSGSGLDVSLLGSSCDVMKHPCTEHSASLRPNCRSLGLEGVNVGRVPEVRDKGSRDLRVLDFRETAGDNEGLKASPHRPSHTPPRHENLEN